MLTRNEARIRSMEVIYQCELGVRKKEEISLSGTDPFVKKLLTNVWDESALIEEKLKESLIDWSLERLGFLEKAILFLGTGELLFEKDIPLNVSLDEWVGISKKYCGEEAKVLVNGILNNIKNTIVTSGLRESD